jgi:hypothetical protein
MKKTTTLICATIALGLGSAPEDSPANGTSSTVFRPMSDS